MTTNNTTDTVDYYQPKCGHDNCISRGWKCSSCKNNPDMDYYEPYIPYIYPSPTWTPTYTVTCSSGNTVWVNPCDTCCNFE